MSDPFLGEIRLFGCNFAPLGWALCDGQLLSIAENTALFSLLGTTYGGNGTSTFALPDLRGRVALSSGQGPGLSNYAQGSSAGTESVALTEAQLPTHTHKAVCSSSPGQQASPVTNVWAAISLAYRRNPGVNQLMNPNAITTTGGNQAHENRQPFLALNYCIALQGIYPSRE